MVTRASAIRSATIPTCVSCPGIDFQLGSIGHALSGGLWHGARSTDRRSRLLRLRDARRRRDAGRAGWEAGRCPRRTTACATSSAIVDRNGYSARRSASTTR
jgi:hypothetical protein